MNSFNIEYLMIKISYKDSTLKRGNATNSNENRKRIQKNKKHLNVIFVLNN